MKAVINAVEGVKFTFPMMGVFCPCCGMALRMSPTSKRDKERLRQLQLRIKEEDRIIRIIKGTKK
jgi:hypothetical protein